MQTFRKVSVEPFVSALRLCYVTLYLLADLNPSTPFCLRLDLFSSLLAISVYFFVRTAQSVDMCSSLLADTRFCICQNVTKVFLLESLPWVQRFFHENVNLFIFKHISAFSS